MNSEHTLVELKAKIEDKDKETIKKKILELKAKQVGKFHQIDTYFYVPKGRLKLREVEGKPYAQLIYYERENVSSPKKSKVFILNITKPKEFKEMLKNILSVKSVVDKIREIYFYMGTQIHLDEVKNLGSFIEFEKQTVDEHIEIEKAKIFLKELMRKLEIAPKNLIKVSYGELVPNVKNFKNSP